MLMSRIMQQHWLLLLLLLPALCYAVAAAAGIPNAA